MHNIKHWCPLREVDIVQNTPLKRVALLNDFVANGYGAIELKPDELAPIFVPKSEDSKWNDDSVKIVQGIGTGYGGCQLTREPSRTPGVPGKYHVNSAEVGMTRLTLYG